MPTFIAKRVVSYRTSVTKDGLFELQLIDEQNRGATIVHTLDLTQALAIARTVFDLRDAGKLGPMKFPRRPAHVVPERQPSEQDDCWPPWDGD